jgi:ribose transport system substrate-binding protein
MLWYGWYDQSGRSVHSVKGVLLIQHLHLSESGRGVGRGVRWSCIGVVAASAMVLAGCSSSGKAASSTTTAPSSTTSAASTAASGAPSTPSSAASATSSAVASPASTGSPNGKSVQVAFGFPYTSVEVYKPLIAGAKAEATKLGAQILQSSAQLNAGAQVTELNTWIAQGVGALVILPLDLNSLAPVVASAHKAGTKVIGYSTQIPGADGAILWSDAQGAQLVGGAAADWVNGQKGGTAQVGLLTQEAVATGKARIDGSVAALQKAAPGAKVVASAEAPDAAHAYAVTLSMLQAHPNISVILCVNDDDEIGAARALKQLNKAPASVWLGGFDGSLTALKEINSGAINGVTAALPLEPIGEAVTQFGVDAANGSGPTSKTFDYILAKNNDPSVVEPLIQAYG